VDDEEPDLPEFLKNGNGVSIDDGSIDEKTKKKKRKRRLRVKVSPKNKGFILDGVMVDIQKRIGNYE
jgi:pyruvate kinase